MSSLPRLDVASIPDTATRAVLEAGAPAAIWVVAGTATVTVEGRHWHLSAGKALWLPGGQGAIVRGAAGSCVLPVRARAADRSAGPTAPFVATVPSEARRALMAAFTRSLDVLRGGGVRASAVLGFIGSASAEIVAPRLPHSPDLAGAAAELLDRPEATPTQVAAAHGMSVAALRRRLCDETGWTPSRWRSRARLARAVQLLRAGEPATVAATSTGYGSPQALTRALQREWGVTPGAVAAHRDTEVVVRRRPLTLGPQRNAYHVIAWVAAGSARLRVDGAPRTVTQDQLFCLPANRSIELRAPAEATIIVLGWLPGGIEIEPGPIARIDGDDSVALLRLAAWAYADVAPRSQLDPRIVLQQALGLHEPETPSPTAASAAYALLDRLSREPQDNRPVRALAAQIGVEPEPLRKAVEALTGTTLASWRAQTRMSLARRMLRDGVHAAQVAQRLGYADASGFTRAFTRAQGVPPAAFRRQQIAETPR